MPRSFRECIFQTLLFEAGGLALATPLYEALAGPDARSPIVLLIALSLAVLFWSPLHNAAFDWLETRLTSRNVSDRPHRLRLLHAISHEVTPIAVTLPLIMLIGRHTLPAALAVNGGLTALYLAYAYAFYWMYNRMRPVGQGGVVAML